MRTSNIGNATPNEACQALYTKYYMHLTSLLLVYTKENKDIDRRGGGVKPEMVNLVCVDGSNSCTLPMIAGFYRNPTPHF